MNCGNLSIIDKNKYDVVLIMIRIDEKMYMDA